MAKARNEERYDVPKSQPLDMWEQFEPDAPIVPSRLSEFMMASVNSVVREQIFTRRFLSDIKIAAAMSSYHLQSYEPDVDRDGHDVVLEDEMRTINLQLKTLLGQTDSWGIRKRLLRPESRYCKSFGFKEPDISIREEEGLQGGVVLIAPKIEEGVLKNIEYFYSDIFVIYALGAGLVPGKKVPSTSVAQIKKDLHSGMGSEKMSLKRHFFLNAIDAERLLGLAGLSSRYSSSWRLNVLRYIGTSEQDGLASGEKEEWLPKFSGEIKKNLEQLINNG